ncbi:hypothetical protein OUZ56_009441 [Daphnia magna]|uniref:Uncharacterized protein n=1 Tax=Daphnia magna TaxID=35525 RepID=A0ABR0AG11_9CRUS|nr:hypothetical protein OUZ56_009441 [Daphnia magna]
MPQTPIKLSQSDNDVAMGDSEDELTPSQEIINSSFQQLDQIAAVLGKSPLFSNKRLSSEQRQVVASKQIKKIVPALAEKVSVAYKVPIEDVVSTKEQSDDYDELISEIKSSFEASQSLIERKQLLTLLPKSWNRQKIVKEMQCSDFLAKEAIRLRNEVGILPKLKSKLSGKRLSDSDLSTIIQFYEENSKTSLGMKDVIMINREGEHPFAPKVQNVNNG